MVEKFISNRLPPCHGIIPARYQSSRFPGKPLADILGRPMIWHVFEQARQCKALLSVVLATDDERIRSAAQKWDIPVVMTRYDHPSGTDRVLEAAEKMELEPEAVIVNIQGDEPALEPAMLDQLIKPFREPRIQVTTLARRIDSREAENQNLVKIVFATDRRALYFSRAVIPFRRQTSSSFLYGHVGIYAFRMQTLKRFVSLDQSPLEVTEGLEQLRLIDNHIPIHVVETEHRSLGVDRPEDIETVSMIIQRRKAASGPKNGQSDL